jgi:hypothetical protein
MFSSIGYYSFPFEAHMKKRRERERDPGEEQPGA